MGAVSSAYRLRCGVRQGVFTSPRLFNLYINGLVGELSNTAVGCCIDGQLIKNIGHAGDMAVLGSSLSAVRKLLELCEKYAADHARQSFAAYSQRLALLLNILRSSKTQWTRYLNRNTLFEGTPFKASEGYFTASCLENQEFAFLDVIPKAMGHSIYNLILLGLILRYFLLFFVILLLKYWSILISI